MISNKLNKLPVINKQDPCGLLQNYIKQKNGKADYNECSYYLNNFTDMTQIQIQTCLNNFFPNVKVVNNAWTGIL